MDNLLSRTLDLPRVVNPENNTKNDWIVVPQDLAETTVFQWSMYFRSAVDNRTSYESSELFLDGGRELMAVLGKIDPSGEEKSKLEVKAFVDPEANVIEMRINLKNSPDFLAIKGKALEDTARSYFFDKEKENR